ncbi:putative copper homeostasis (lipo)protein LpqS [Mycobacterium basiliense]
MQFGAPRPRRWLRYLIAVAAVGWLLGIAAACQAPVRDIAARPASPTLVTVAGNLFAKAPAVSRPDADCCLPGTHSCAAAVQTGVAVHLVVLAVVVTVLALVVRLAGTALVTARAPPRLGQVAFAGTGRNVLTRLCISRC